MSQQLPPRMMAALRRRGLSLRAVQSMSADDVARLTVAPSDARTTVKKSRHLEEEETEETSDDDEPTDEEGEEDEGEEEPKPSRAKPRKSARLPVAPAMLHGESDLARTKRVLRSHVDAMNGGRTSIMLAADPIDHLEAPYQLDSKPYATLPADLRKAVRQGLDPATAYVIALERG